MREAILAEHGFGPYAAEGLLRILGCHDYLALDSWIRKRYRELYRGPAKSVDRAIARRYGRYGAFQGLALWLEMTSTWHEEVESRESRAERLRARWCPPSDQLSTLDPRRSTFFPPMHNMLCEGAVSPDTFLTPV